MQIRFDTYLVIVYAKSDQWNAEYCQQVLSNFGVRCYLMTSENIELFAQASAVVVLDSKYSLGDGDVSKFLSQAAVRCPVLISLKIDDSPQLVLDLVSEKGTAVVRFEDLDELASFLMESMPDLMESSTSACGGYEASQNSRENARLLDANSFEAETTIGPEGRGNFENSSSEDREPVNCTIFAPPEVGLNETMLIQVFVHFPKDKDAIESMSKEFDSDSQRRGFTSLGTEIKSGSKLTFELSIEGYEIKDNLQEIIWGNVVTCVTFSLRIPIYDAVGSRIGKLSVSQDSVPIGRIYFKFIVTERPRKRPDKFTSDSISIRYTKAFISYASQDRAEVLKRVHMLESVGIPYFQDLMNLRPGELWERGLYRLIDESDVLFLFWSTAVQKSEWVTKEWKYGIDRKGEEFILPVVIEGPPTPIPPPELSRIHFSDKLLYFLR